MKFLQSISQQGCQHVICDSFCQMYPLRTRCIFLHPYYIAGITPTKGIIFFLFCKILTKMSTQRISPSAVHRFQETLQLTYGKSAKSYKISNEYAIYVSFPRPGILTCFANVPEN